MSALTLARRSLLALACAACLPVRAGSYEDFFVAVVRDDPGTINALLQRGFDPNTRDPKGQVGLTLALQNGSFKVFDALLQARGLQVDARNTQDESPLMIAALRGEFPGVVVLMVSAQDDPDIVRRALAYGAAGYVPKSLDLEGIRAALDAVLSGETWLPPALKSAVDAQPARDEDRDISSRLARLTPQQIRVLQLLAQGRLNKQIADTLGIQERTVKAHVSAIFERLGVRNRTQAGVLLGSLELGR